MRENGAPRILITTPAGNSGVGLWFKPTSGRGLHVEHAAEPVEHQGRAGVSLALSGPAELEVDRVMLDSVRALRDKDHGAEASRDALVRHALDVFEGPAGRKAGVTQEMIDRLSGWLEPRAITDPERPGVLILERRALGSGATYRVEIEPRAGTHVAREHGAVVLHGDGETRFTVNSFIDRAPLTPLARVLDKPSDAAQERNLGLLVFKEKFLAGSYQYLTYFGRDTLISSRLLGDKLSSGALSTAVGSVLDRVSPRGRVAHEESNGDQATLEALPRLMKDIAAGRRVTPERLARLERPVHDYKMMDGEFLLPSLVADLAARATPAELSTTLTPARLDALARVVVRVIDETTRWSGASVTDLVHLRRGQIVGNWRDSGEGLGGGLVPLDVNAYLVPAALDALGRLLEQPGFPKEALLARVAQRRPAARAALQPRALAARRGAWKDAERAFEVSVPGGVARDCLRAYVGSYPAAEREVLLGQKLWSGRTIREALDHGAPELDGGVRFPGLSLDGRGQPTPVLSSDEAFQLFYGRPEKAALVAAVTRLFQPFPVGLMTEVGLVVANPAYSDRPEDCVLFDRDHYHGAVVWSWPQTMMRRGLEQQRTRFAGDAEVEATIDRALASLDGRRSQDGRDEVGGAVDLARRRRPRRPRALRRLRPARDRRRGAAALVKHVLAAARVAAAHADAAHPGAQRGHRRAALGQRALVDSRGSRHRRTRAPAPRRLPSR